MVFAGVPKSDLVEVLGWVNMGKSRYVIIKDGDNYYRASFITEIQKVKKGVQFPLEGGGWEFPELTQVKVKDFNRGVYKFVVDRDESKNLELYEKIVEYKRRVESAGQIFY